MTSLQQEQVGIIGAGALGRAIAGHLARCGIPGVICNSRAPATLEAFIRTLGPTIRAATLEEAVGPEIVIMAVPWASVPEVLERIARMGRPHHHRRHAPALPRGWKPTRAGWRFPR